MEYTSEKIGQFIRRTRKGAGLTQEDVALSAGTGLRFIVDLENGKPTCEMAKVLNVLNTLGIKMTLVSPIAEVNRYFDER